MDPTTRFSDRVTYYVQSRPKYPRAILQFAKDKLNLEPTDTIADIGSGTGFLTQLFLENGNTVYAIEPNAPMREAGEHLLNADKNFHSINATAEATTLPDDSINLVTAGQAFHWFDPPKALAEFQRILKPQGWVMLVWNERRNSHTGFDQAYHDIVEKFSNGLKVDHHRSVTSTDSTILPSFFAPAKFETARFENIQKLDREGVRARALSSSYMPLPGHPRCQEMLEALDAAFDKNQIDGFVQIAYDTKVYCGQIKKV